MTTPETPDQLKKPVAPSSAGFDELSDFLWDLASWDPDIERVLQGADREGTPQRLVDAAQRLLDERRLSDPGTEYEAVRLLAELCALNPDRLDTRIRRPWRGIRLANLPGVHTSLADACRDEVRDLGVREATARHAGVSVLCITGSRGVGKTRLADQILAEACVREDTALRLEVSLSSAEEAIGAGGPIAKPADDALLELLLDLGVSEAEIPHTLEERRGRYVAELAGSRPLIMIDDAVEASQVLPLLPPEDGFVVVTSRVDLPELSGMGAGVIRLEPLTLEGTRLLVEECLRDSPIEPGDVIVRAVHEWCGGIPALTILVSRWIAATADAERLPSAALAERIGTAPAVFSLFDEHQQVVLRVLGMIRGGEADTGIVCLSGHLGRDQARAALERLVDVGLVERAGGSPDCWRMDPRVAGYAGVPDLTQTTDIEFDAGQALRALMGVYGWRAGQLRDLMCSPSLECFPLAKAWAEAEWVAERGCFAAVLDAAAAAASPADARPLAAAFADVAFLDGDWRETGRHLTAVLDVARAAHDRGLEAKTLLRFGCEALRRREYESATALLTAAGEFAGAAGKLGPEEVEEILGGRSREPRNGLERIEAIVAPATGAPVSAMLFGKRRQAR